MPLFGRDPRKLGRNKDIDLTDLIVDFPVHVRMDLRSVSEIKRLPSTQRASQGGIQMRRGLMGFITRVFGEREDYMRAYPPVNGQFSKRYDLFDL
jgi:hypothetical protein